MRCRYKRIRKRSRKQETEEVYDYKVELLGGLESLSEKGVIDLVYTDAGRVSVQPCVPYGWQFADEDVFMPSTQGAGLNGFAILRRDNWCRYETSRESIPSQVVFEQMEQLSMEIEKLTVVVLDNAPVHVAGVVQARRGVWEKRGL